MLECLASFSHPCYLSDSYVTVSACCLEHEQCLAASGLDLHSCLHFLLDLYSQWTLPQVIIYD
jgi:hypothetical protein